MNFSKKNVENANKSNVIIDIHKRITIIDFMIYFFKSIFFDKASIVLSLIFQALSIILALVAAVATRSIYVLNWFSIFSLILCLIMISRVCSYFLYIKNEDKSNVINIQQKISRASVFISIFISIFLYLLINIFISNGIGILFNVSNTYSVKYLTVNCMFLIISSFGIIAFCMLLNLALRQQIVSIILSFLLLSFFIAPIPQQLMVTKMEKLDLTLNSSDYNENTYKVEEINDAIKFQNNVKLKNIKFPNLSKYINDSFLSDKFTISNYETSVVSVQQRLDIWRNIGIVNSGSDSSYLMKDGNVGYDWNLAVKKVDNNKSGFEKIEAGDPVKVNLAFKNTFKTYDEILANYSSENNLKRKTILKEFIDFYKYYEDIIIKNKSISKNNILSYIWNDKHELYGDFISKQLDTEKSTLNVTKDGVDTKQSINSVAFMSYFFNNYFFDSNNKSQMLLFEYQGVDGKEYNDLIKKIEQQFYMEIITRVLEEYFIHQTSDYTIISHSTITDNKNFQKYSDYIDKIKLLQSLNFISSANAIFNNSAGKDPRLFWFNYETTSSIDFTNQDNPFFSTFNHDYKKDADGNIINFKNVNIFIIIIPEIVIAIFAVIGSLYMFIRKDFK